MKVRASAALLLLVSLALGTGAASGPVAAGQAETGPPQNSLDGKVLRIGFLSTGPDDLPIWPAIDALEEQGVTVEITEFAGEDVSVPALASREVDVNWNTTTAATVAGVEAGAPITIVASHTRNTQSLVSRADIDSPEDLAGKRIGVHSELGFSMALVQNYLDEQGIEAEVLIVPGSENRAAALASGELDAAGVSVQDFAVLDGQHPGEFIVLEPFAETLPDLMPLATQASVEFIEEEPELAAAFVDALVDGFATVNDLETAQAIAREQYPDFAPTEELLDRQVQVLVEGGYFPEDGLLTPEICRATVEWLIEAGQITDVEPPVDDTRYCRYDLIEAARAS
jgi:ABC-type nitrate/sulfonate/bicarbonate transport system substrate-binding protein